MPPFSVTLKAERRVQRLKTAWSSFLELQHGEGASKTTDTHLICDDGAVPVHGSLLAQASPFFTKLFISQGNNYVGVRSVILSEFKLRETYMMVQLLYCGFVNLQSEEDLIALEHVLTIFEIVPLQNLTLEKVKSLDTRMVFYYEDCKTAAEQKLKQDDVSFAIQHLTDENMDKKSRTNVDVEQKSKRTAKIVGQSNASDSGDGILLETQSHPTGGNKQETVLTNFFDNVTILANNGGTRISPALPISAPVHSTHTSTNDATVKPPFQDIHRSPSKIAIKNKNRKRESSQDISTTSAASELESGEKLTEANEGENAHSIMEPTRRLRVTRVTRLDTPLVKVLEKRQDSENCFSPPNTTRALRNRSLLNLKRKDLSGCSMESDSSQSSDDSFFVTRRGDVRLKRSTRGNGRNRKIQFDTATNRSSKKKSSGRKGRPPGRKRHRVIGTTKSDAPCNEVKTKESHSQLFVPQGGQRQTKLEESDEEDDIEMDSNFYNDSKKLYELARKCFKCKQTYMEPREASNCVRENHKMVLCYLCFNVTATQDFLIRHYQRKHYQFTRDSTIICPYSGCQETLDFSSVSTHVITRHIYRRDAQGLMSSPFNILRPSLERRSFEVSTVSPTKKPTVLPRLGALELVDDMDRKEVGCFLSKGEILITRDDGRGRQVTYRMKN